MLGGTDPPGRQENDMDTRSMIVAGWKNWRPAWSTGLQVFKFVERQLHGLNVGFIYIYIYLNMFQLSLYSFYSGNDMQLTFILTFILTFGLVL